MKKIALALILTSSLLLAELKNIVVTPEFLTKDIPIVDIRTPGEWRETGIVKGSSTIVFFDDRGGYDIEKFLKELNKVVDTKKEFAIICRTGSRTAMVGDFLSSDMKYKVINLKGGINKLMRDGYKPAEYRP